MSEQSLSEESVQEALQKPAGLASQLDEGDRLLVGAVLAYAADAVAEREGQDVAGFSMANVDLQNMLQKQQQSLQLMSSVSKKLHDTSAAIIRNIG